MIRKVVVVAAGSLTFGAVQAQAGPFSSTGLSCGSGVCTETITALSQPSLGGSFAIDYFNPSVGSLTSVGITIEPTATLTQGDVINSSSVSSTATFHSHQAITLDDSPTSLIKDGLNALFDFPITTTVITENLGTISPGATAQVTGLPIVQTNTVDLSYNTGLASWESNVGGQDTVDLSITSLFSADFFGGSSYNSGGNYNDGMTVVVNYDYGNYPVPEPAAAVVLASGLAGLLAMRRRRNQG